MKECEHLFNHEETYCTKCMKPTWQIAHENGIDKLTELEQKLDAYIDGLDQKFSESLIGNCDLINERIEKLEQKLDKIPKHDDYEQLQRNFKLITDKIISDGEHLFNTNKEKIEKLENIQIEIYDALFTDSKIDKGFIKQLSEQHFEGHCHPTKVGYLNLIKCQKLIREVLIELFDAHDGEFEEEWSERRRKELEGEISKPESLKDKLHNLGCFPQPKEPTDEPKTVYDRLQECDGDNILKEQPEEVIHIPESIKLWCDSFNFIVVAKEDLEFLFEIGDYWLTLAGGYLPFKGYFTLKYKTLREKYLGDEKKDGTIYNIKHQEGLYVW